jgi:predicted RNA binding protein YcfA (HicA-like mRNA interferase family)
VSGINSLISRILNRKNVVLDDCDKLLIYYGYQLHKGGGSHRVYHKKGVKPITIVQPKGKKYIGAAYLNRIIIELGLEGDNENK